jgi:hypothetical protein
VRGEQYQPLPVLPVLLIAPDEPLKFSLKDNSFEGELNITSKKKDVKALVMFESVSEIDDSRKVSYDPMVLNFSSANSTIPIKYKVEANRDNLYSFHIKKDSLSSRLPFYSQELHQIKYDHIPTITYFSEANVKNVKLDLKTYNKKIGYIIGAGDKVPEALEQMGYEVSLLTDKELSRNHLEQFDAIITGVRAYNTNEWMNKHYDKLMKYVENGGNLIVQYNTSNNIGPVRAKISPYNFTISRTRVTDENSPVKFLKPEHPVFNFPNRITQDDFKGWIQERSIYHATAWDSTKFQTVLALNDPGEKADEGSLIIAQHGKGYFTYTGLVFFRELPAGVTGAFRLLANIIALNRKKPF